MDSVTLKKRADKLFEKRGSLLSLWQTLAENFYSERADFTSSRNVGEEFASNLLTSYPVLARRDLGDSFSSLLRQDEWFEMSVNFEEDVDHDGKLWLERATKIMRRAMADRIAKFDRATKEGDHDYATFGQCVLSVQLNNTRDALLYRCWHLRDVAWCENAEGEIDMVVRKWKPFAVDLLRLFPKTVSQNVRDMIAKDPYTEVECLHIVCASDHYSDAKLKQRPFVSSFMECKDAHILEQVGVQNRIYVIPRWQTVSGSQYAYSPASIVALPDARLIQSMTGVLLEAGEKAVNPPMVARQEVLRSDVAIYAGGITWADSEYDERLGDPLKMLMPDAKGLPLGLEMQQDVRSMIREAFFLNKLTMPQPGREMTAYEVGQRVSEWIRQSLPLFRPMETDYNGALCEATFDVLMAAGAFGPVNDIPQSLSRADIQFKFKTPLREAKELKNANVLQQTRALLDAVIEIDPSAANVVNLSDAYREAVEGIGMSHKHIRSEEDAQAITDQQTERAESQRQLAEMQQGGQIAKDLGAANKSLKEAA